jgi:hypothetical protein
MSPRLAGVAVGGWHGGHGGWGWGGFGIGPRNWVARQRRDSALLGRLRLWSLRLRLPARWATGMLQRTPLTALLTVAVATSHDAGFRIVTVCGDESASAADR